MNERRKLSIKIAVRRMSWVVYAGFFWFMLEEASRPVTWILTFVLIFYLEIKLADWSFDLEARKQNLIEKLREKS